MQNIDKLNPPIQYKFLWFVIGLCLVGAIVIWYAVALWITRRKKPKSLDSLKQLPPHLNLEQLKAKYLQIIQDLYQSHMRQEITLRKLHHELSMAVRNFVYDANYFPAPFLTLSDLRMSPYPQLANLIAQYYPEEFAAITDGTAESSVQAAQGVVTQWPY